MGPISALAKDPVQNSKDASQQEFVRVEYRLVKRKAKTGGTCYLLTVTDTGTSGLQGPILRADEIQERNSMLNEGEDWAAFEAQGFTKTGDSDLGSRGQGKNAFLYFSKPPVLEGEQRIILYDTLLEDGEYRFGARRATNIWDGAMYPPRLGDDARNVISNGFPLDDDMEIPLGLEPLQAVGTRVIVPYVDREVIDAIHTGELHKWLQRSWWRAIQDGELEISVVDEVGSEDKIQVPSWWEGMPWNKRDGRISVEQDVPIQGEMRIKRIVLLHDENLKKDEIGPTDEQTPQYSGVQLLRGKQWIQTLSVTEQIGDPDHVDGFRGFVEFNEAFEAELRSKENPTHETFVYKSELTRTMRTRIQDSVRQFAGQQGWVRKEVTKRPPKREQDVSAQFLRLFTEPVSTRGGDGGLQSEESVKWECQVLLDFPNDQSARVDWGESIERVGVDVRCDPPHGESTVDISLAMTHDNGLVSTFGVTKSIEVQGGRATVEFGDFKVIRGAGKPGDIRCDVPGKWRLRAEVSKSGEQVASASRHIFVEEDPPVYVGPQTQTISVDAKNLSRAGVRRINNGEEISIRVIGTNHVSDDAKLKLTVSLGHLPLARNIEVSIPGTPAGDVPDRPSCFYESYAVYTSEQPESPKEHLVLEPGRYNLRADLKSLEGEVVAHASRPVYIEVDPSGNRSRLPFNFRMIDEIGSHPMWRLRERSEGDWELTYPGHHPLRQAIPAGQDEKSQLVGRSAFLLEITAEALLEWSLLPLGTGDDTRLQQLKQNQPPGITTASWENFSQRIDQIGKAYVNLGNGDHMEFTELSRQVVADMIEMFRRMG